MQKSLVGSSAAKTYSEEGPRQTSRNGADLFRPTVPAFARGQGGRGSSRARGLVWSLAACLWVGGFGGCSQDVSESIVDHQMKVSRADQLRVTTDYVFTDEQFDNAEFEQKVSGGLNRWFESQAAENVPVEWSPDPLIDSLPAEVKSEVDALEQTTFLTTDTHYVQGQMWIRELVRAIGKRPLARGFWPPLTAALGDQPVDEGWRSAFADAYPEFSEADRDQLLLVCKLFDWTTMNIQLADRRDWPSAAVVAAQRLADDDEAWPPKVGVRGPGYNRFAWQTLLFGQGDDLERARVFLQLVHEAGLDGVMLAIKSAGESDLSPFGYRCWLPAVRVGNELFLFDTELGLPLPASNPTRFATLGELVGDPGLIRQWDLSAAESTSDDADYRVRPDDLQHGIVALVEVPIESLTRRMAVLERGLTGDERLRLTSQPSKIAQAVQGLSGVGGVQLSPLDACTHQFRAAVETGEQTAKFNADVRERLAWRVLEEEYINSYVRFRKGKNKYFRDHLMAPRGVIDRGAIEWFQLMRYDDEFIETLHENASVLEALGIGNHLPVVEYNRRLSNTKEHMRLVRADATYCLALCHLFDGNPSVAATWLGRVDAFDQRNFWDVGVRYLQGRCAEMLGDTAAAAAIYRTGKDDQRLKPQAYGNLLRARLLTATPDSFP